MPFLTRVVVSSQSPVGIREIERNEENSVRFSLETLDQILDIVCGDQILDTGFHGVAELVLLLCFQDHSIENFRWQVDDGATAVEGGVTLLLSIKNSTLEHLSHGVDHRIGCPALTFDGQASQFKAAREKAWK